MRWLINQIVDSGQSVNVPEFTPEYFPGDDLFSILRPTGLPIGNLTSQLWANVYLNGFDHFVKRTLRCPAYLRYVDDCLLFGDYKTELWDCLKQMIRYLYRMRLLLHSGSQPRPVSDGVPFLGFVTYPDKRLLKRRKGIAFQRTLKRLEHSFRRNKVSLVDVTIRIQAWVNHCSYGNTAGLRVSVLGRVCFHRNGRKRHPE